MTKSELTLCAAITRAWVLARCRVYARNLDAALDAAQVPALVGGAA